MRGAPFGLRPCKARKPLKIRDVGNDPCVVPLRLKDIFLWGRRFIPSHQSLTRQTACSFLPLRGKPFCKRPFALHDKVISGNLYTRPHPSPAAPPSPSKGKAFGGSADFKKSASTIWNLDITILGFKHSDVNISKQKRKKSAQ